MWRILTLQKGWSVHSVAGADTMLTVTFVSKGAILWPFPVALDATQRSVTVTEWEEKKTSSVASRSPEKQKDKYLNYVRTNNASISKHYHNRLRLNKSCLKLLRVSISNSVLLNILLLVVLEAVHLHHVYCQRVHPVALVWWGPQATWLTGATNTVCRF